MGESIKRAKDDEEEEEEQVDGRCAFYWGRKQEPR